MDGEVQCRVCNAPLVLGENWTNGVSKNKQRICRSCNSEKGKAHYKLHAEKAHRKQLERLRKPENEAKAKEYRRAYYAKNKEKWKSYQQLSGEKKRTSPWHRSGALITWVRTRAASAGYAFDLTREWAEQRINAGFCEATGIKFDFSKDKQLRFNPWMPSIDRIDSSKGYTMDNCRMVVWSYNMAKAEWTDDVVYQLAKAVVASREETQQA